MKTLEEKKARLGEIKTELESITDFANAENISTIETLNAEYEVLLKEIQAEEKVLEMKNKIGSSAGRQSATPGQTPGASAAPARKTQNGKYGFDNDGEFFAAVKDQAFQKGYDDRLKAAQQEKVGADGGFLVIEDFRSEITDKFGSDESLLSRTKQFNVSGNRLSMPINEFAPWDSSGNHIQAKWKNEGGSYEESSTKFDKLNIELEKLTALVYVTEEMLEDAAMIESYIRSETPDVMMHKVNDAIVSGDGVGKPEGYLNCPFGFEVSKEGGQAADTVIFENLKKLYTHALPRAKQSGVFLHNVAVEEQLIGMRLDTASTDSVSVYLPNNSIDGAPYGTLWGKPIFPMMGSMPALGDKGDIAFADFSFYYTALKTAGIKQAVSTHVRFDTDEIAYKFSIRLGGKCPFKSAAATQFGSYNLSGFTYLEDRA